MGSRQTPHYPILRRAGRIRQGAARDALLLFAFNTMNRLLKLTAIIEAATGLGLIAVSAVIVRLLLGAEISGASIPLGRVTGVALLALGVACWFASYDVQNRGARGLVSAMVLYNLGVVLILGTAGLQSPPAGIVLWPAVILHAVMGTWCVASLRRNPPL
jgi:hypothetical protein